MPKIIDNYILERKLSAGQFGEVYKGYNKLTNQDVAIKAIKRDNLRGKFIELLETEIRVLKSCDNVNIMKLFDLKKTSNNFYLILEYCSEGDLSQYLKAKRFLTEDEAVNFFLQILNGFKTLVKTKIMHRDLKLANILKHNGIIKLADFGFAKLLGTDNYTATMLGSPLNMAPEVLDGKEYNSKADIWSVGTCFYELLFGKPPYTANNIIDLIKTIKTKSLEFPRKINNISKVCEDVLRKMLVVNPYDRIDWDELFDHPINFYEEEKIKKELELTLKNQGLALSMNMSKFYIKNNQVVNHTIEIKQKEQLNQFTVDVISGNNYITYEGPILKRQTTRNEQQQQILEDQKFNSISSESKGLEESKQDTDQIISQESQREKLIKITKNNSNRLLHERNKYVFLASVSEDALNQDLSWSCLVAFFLVKKLLMLQTNMKLSLLQKTNIYGLPEWDYYTKTKEYQDICTYITREYDVFKVYFDNIFQKLTNELSSGILDNINEEITASINLDLMQNCERPLTKIIQKYCSELIDKSTNSKEQLNEDQIKTKLFHVDQTLDCLRLELIFKFNHELQLPFNFKQFYEETNQYALDDLILRVQQKFHNI